ncbi:MAG: ATP synthase F0 subunit B [Bacteriovoracia bacterium]
MQILELLGLNATYFVQLGLFVVIFAILSQVYFKPFMKLFEARHKRTVEDREAAEKLLVQAQEKMQAYERSLADAKAEARKQYEAVVTQARQEESSIYAQARDEVKKITQETNAELAKQRDQLKTDLETQVTQFATQVSERLLSK